MRFIQILPHVIINPEHISHIKCVIMSAPADDCISADPFAHDYPVYVVTMTNGITHDIVCKYDCISEDTLFDPIDHILQQLAR